MTDIQQHHRFADPPDWTYRPTPPRPYRDAAPVARHSPAPPQTVAPQTVPPQTTSPRTEPPKTSTPQTVSLLHPTGEFAKKIAAVARAREAEEAIPKTHLPRRWLVLRMRWGFPLPRIRKRCRHCRHLWPCRSLTRFLRDRHGADIGLAVFRLSTRRLRARADRRSDTAITHRATPRRIHHKERALGLK